MGIEEVLAVIIVVLLIRLVINDDWYFYSTSYVPSTIQSVLSISCTLQELHEVPLWPSFTDRETEDQRD